MRTALALSIFCLSCTGFLVDPGKACDTMSTNGFTGCRLLGTEAAFPSWSGCDERDAVAFDVSAVNAAGRRVSAVVCCGWPLKGCTVRAK